MQLDGILAELIIQVAPALYPKYVTTGAHRCTLTG